MADWPLNPTLYSLLCRRFGEQNVEVVAPGLAINWTLHRPADRSTDSPPVRLVRVSGEEYKVPCPFCHDYKPRLFINHRWGVFDPDSNSRNLWMCQCFNAGCLESLARREQLYDQLYTTNVRRKVEIRNGRQFDPAKLIEAQPPGPMTRLDKLAERQPRHHAIKYLESRLLDPIRLGKQFGVAYCADSRYRLASNRIIIPVYERGTLYGWQARYIGDDVNGVPFNKAGVPKYWTMPNYPRKVIGYKMEEAVRHQTVIMVEGPADVWGAGPQAFGLFGKTINPLLVKKLQRWLSLYWDNEAVVVVLLDPDQDAVALKKGKPHHIEVAADRLRDGLRPGQAERVLPVYLPSGTDPGSLAPAFIRAAIREAAAKADLPVHFSKTYRKPAVDPARLVYDPLKRA